MSADASAMRAQEAAQRLPLARALLADEVRTYNISLSSLFFCTCAQNLPILGRREMPGIPANLTSEPKIFDDRFFLIFVSNCCLLLQKYR